MTSPIDRLVFVARAASTSPDEELRRAAWDALSAIVSEERSRPYSVVARFGHYRGPRTDLDLVVTTPYDASEEEVREEALLSILYGVSKALVAMGRTREVQTLPFQHGIMPMDDATLDNLARRPRRRWWRFWRR